MQFHKRSIVKEGYLIKNQSAPHFITSTVVDWVDIFSRKVYRDEVIKSLDYCISKKGMILYGYVIMTNHVHMIVQSKEGKLSDLIRDFKKFTSKSILRLIQTEPESRRDWMLERFRLATATHSRNKEYQFWQYGNHPEEIYSTKFMWSKLDYIHLNPVRAGFVSKASHYLYSSASNYVYDEGLLTIEKVDNPIVDTLNLVNLNRYDLY